MSKHDTITVKLTGRDENAFSIIASVTKAMRKHGCSKADIDA